MIKLSKKVVIGIAAGVISIGGLVAGTSIASAQAAQVGSIDTGAIADAAAGAAAQAGSQ